MILRKIGRWPEWGGESPFNELDRLKREMDRLAGMLPDRSYERPAGVFPLVNLTEDQERYFLRAELPGIQVDDLDISVTGNSISLSGERKIPAEDEKATYHRRERDAGSFSRIINLPEKIDNNKIEAAFKNGVLTVILPKAEETKPRKIAVKSA